MGSRPRAQSPLSVNKTSQWQLACVFRHAHPAPQRGYKRRARANAHQLFASEPSLFSESPRVSARQHFDECWCDGASAEVAVQCCFIWACCSSHSAVALRPPLGASTLFSFSKRAISKRAISKRAPRATGGFLKMASRSCVSGCGNFLA